MKNEMMILKEVEKTHYTFFDSLARDLRACLEKGEKVVVRKATREERDNYTMIRVKEVE